MSVVSLNANLVRVKLNLQRDEIKMRNRITIQKNRASTSAFTLMEVMLALMVSDIFPSTLYDSRHLGGRYPLRESFNYFFFMLFSIRSRVARYSLLQGSEVNAF